MCIASVQMICIRKESKEHQASLISSEADATVSRHLAIGRWNTQFSVLNYNFISLHDADFSNHRMIFDMSATDFTRNLCLLNSYCTQLKPIETLI